MKTLKELREQLAKVQAEMRAIHEEAGDADLDNEQQTRWDELAKQEPELRAQVERREQREARVAALAKQPGTRESGDQRSPELLIRKSPFEADVRTLSDSEALSGARRVLDDKDLAGHLRDDQRERVERVIRTRAADLDGDLVARRLLATQRPAYRSAFQKYASNSHAFTQEEARAIEEVRLVNRALSIGGSAGADGGLAVPVLIDPTIIMTAQGSVNDILRLARVETITNDVWRGISSAGVSWQFNAEAAETTDNSPKIARPEVATHRADGFIPFSIEIGMDWPGFAESMSTLLGEGYNELLANRLTLGTGVNQPWGLVARLDATTTIEVEVATAGTLAAADVYGLWSKLPQRFRLQGSTAWMSSTDVQNTIRQLGTVDPNFSVNITEEAIPRLFGRQYPMNDYMVDMPAGTGTQPLLVLGDFRGYVVAQRAGMTVEFIPMLMGSNNRPTGERGWFAWSRVGGDVVNPAGFRLLTNKAS